MAQIGGKRLVIIGGGLAGLTYLHYIRTFAATLGKTSQLGKIILLEGANYMGGSVKTRVFEDGHVHELGPRSIRLSGPKALNTIVLLEQLGLGDKIVAIGRDALAANERYVYDEGKFFRLPSGLSILFDKIPNTKRSLGSAIFRDFLIARKMDIDKYPERDPPLFEFIKHRFGIEAAENILDPLMRGITAGDARKLSTRSIFGELLQKEQEYGSVLRSRALIDKAPLDDLFKSDIEGSRLRLELQKKGASSYSIKSGLQTITEHLSNSLLNTDSDEFISIYNQSKVDEIEFNPMDSTKSPCSVKVTTVDGDQLVLEADHIVAAMPASDFARTLPPTMPTDQRQALENLTQIPHVPVGCVCVEYRNLDRTKLPSIINSFGFLTNSKSGSQVLGISFDSTMFPEIDAPFNSIRMTCMIGGAWFKEMVGTDNLDLVSNAQLEEIALKEIRRIVKLEEEPFRMSPILWKTGIAQYTPGHKERLQRVRESIEKLQLPLILLGQSYDGFAVNDVVYASRMAAYKFINSL